MAANNGACMTPTLIVTRPAPQGGQFAADLASRWAGGLRVIQSPLLEIVFLPTTIDPPDSVIFTSANGVKAAKAMQWPAGTKAWCVGRSTAQAATQAGFAAIEGPGDAESLAKLIIAAGPLSRIAHIRGRHTRGNLCETLTGAGLHCTDVIGYDQQPLALSADAKAALGQADPVLCPLFSPRTATILHRQGPFAAPLHVVAISDAVKEAMDLRLVASMRVAARPDATAMQDATILALQALTEKG